ncbi:MAG: hypothetical protein J3K34DRAFT_496058 [Monoraphidium minutum]|nr:MAG: hypothetical protein J3K34DRAFT_496058 [Monoraphidium minutum]
MPRPGDYDRYIPLNVRTYGEGFRRLQGWACVSALAFLTGGLLVLYELVVINVEDRDFRDMLFDYRSTQPGVMYQHKHFVNAQFCCNHDPQVFGYHCYDSSLEAYFSAPEGWYAKRQPHCPPAVVFTCAALASAECEQVRALVYPAAGLDPATGQPADCARAGRVRLRAEEGGGGGSQLAADADPGAVFEFFDAVARRYSEPLYTSPPAPLDRGIELGGAPVALAPNFDGGYWDNNNFGWPWELWPWPPGWGCANTGRPPALFLEAFAFAPYNDDQPPAAAVTLFGGAALRLPQYRLEALAAPEAVLGGAAAAAAAVGGNGDLLELRALSGVVLRAAGVPALDACSRWVLDEGWVDVLYNHSAWVGTRDGLRRLLGQGPTSAPSAGLQPVSVQLRDVSEPLPLALPRYGGNIYIYAAVCMGGLWMFSTVPLLAMFVLVFINVRRNKGLPLFIYRYMRRYRGW